MENKFETRLIEHGRRKKSNCVTDFVLLISRRRLSHIDRKSKKAMVLEEIFLGRQRWT